MYSLTLLDDNLINRFDEDPYFSLQNSSPETSSKRKQQYDGGLSDFLPEKYSVLDIECISLSKRLYVSESVCLFHNSSETANPIELKFWGMIPLGIRKVLG